MNELEKLAGKLCLLARPGTTIETEGGQLLIKMNSPWSPETQVLGYSFAPKGNVWQSAEIKVIKGFSEFLEFSSNLIAKTPKRDIFPLGLNGDIFNYGFMLNQHGLRGFFRMSTTFLEEEKEKW